MTSQGLVYILRFWQRSHAWLSYSSILGENFNEKSI
jgi:hypothetical protein